ncbi:hypothetical protein [Aquibacillus salsiterrae]|uniref:Uncharacterized protein n=1 Tax=Aquibacillus salsiterrae TaxID=2950439 RepID=A0A9X3WEH7_9BACI|nr:hypothetical protein [Aquibacillus salsiterrae]MDC3415954.1 hypothetical protein [Aquibacillus salsiterrae]
MKRKMLKVFVAFLAVMLAFSTPVLAAKPDDAGKKEKAEKVEKVPKLEKVEKVTKPMKAGKSDKENAKKGKPAKKEKTYKTKKVDKIKNKLKEDRITRHLDKVEAKVTEVTKAADDYFARVAVETIEPTLTATEADVQIELDPAVNETLTETELSVQGTTLVDQEEEEPTTDLTTSGIELIDNETENQVATEEDTQDEAEATEDDEDVVDSFIGKLRSQLNYLYAIQMQLSRYSQSMEDTEYVQALQARIDGLETTITSEITRIKEQQQAVEVVVPTDVEASETVVDENITSDSNTTAEAANTTLESEATPNSSSTDEINLQSSTSTDSVTP